MGTLLGTHSKYSTTQLHHIYEAIKRVIRISGMQGITIIIEHCLIGTFRFETCIVVNVFPS